MFRNSIFNFSTSYIFFFGNLTKLQLLFISVCYFYFARITTLDSKSILFEAEIETIMKDPFFFSDDEESDAGFDYAEWSDHDTQSDAYLDGHEYDTIWTISKISFVMKK